MGVRLHFVLTQLLHPHWLVLPRSSFLVPAGGVVALTGYSLRLPWRGPDVYL